MAATKRTKPPVEAADEEGDELVITPLGAGQEVGRSCILLEFKGRKVMLDFGIHPGLHGRNALPFVDLVDLETIDLLLISHFHLDHCGALPHLLERTNFRGRCFMTHPTKAIYRWLLADFIRVRNVAADDKDVLFTETDLENSMNKIETLDFHQEKEINGIKFKCYHAGHVLGAAMIMIEIAGVKVLYTGDFSRQEDRHLMSAEIPPERPDVLICESTYGTIIHEERDAREARFTGVVTNILARGGRCLIPVFALGRAQELLLILDEYWACHPELHEIPIYYASSLAKKCISVYQTFVNAMNAKIKEEIKRRNPFVFQHISYLKGIDHFDDVGPCVIMASPGMLQSGLSRELFEMWCTDTRNGVVIAGYCVEGTLAREILSEPTDIIAMNGQKLPLKCSVEHISFSAHTDYKQTSGFIRALKPPHIVLVHGEQHEMSRLKTELLREYQDDPETNIQIYDPRNTQSVKMTFRGEKMAKILGTLATKKPAHDDHVSGILVKRGFKYHIMAPEDLTTYTGLSLSTISQRVAIPCATPAPAVMSSLFQLAGDLQDVRDGPRAGVRVFGVINVFFEGGMVILEWNSSPIHDVFADAIAALILHITAENIGFNVAKVPPRLNIDDEHVARCTRQTLTEAFGSNSVNQETKETIVLTINGEECTVNLRTMDVKCENEKVNQIVTGIVTKLKASMMPIDLVPRAEEVVEK